MDLLLKQKVLVLNIFMTRFFLTLLDLTDL